MTIDTETSTFFLTVARDAIAHALLQQPYVAPSPPPSWMDPRPVFVTLRRADGALRGCMGHLAARQRSLVEEIASDAVLAATNDPRFPPVSIDELSELRVSISILGKPEPIASDAQLDPQRYGIIVTHGSKRGVLLPKIAGIDTIEQQLRVAKSKASIDDQAPVRLSRFEVINVPPH